MSSFKVRAEGRHTRFKLNWQGPYASLPLGVLGAVAGRAAGMLASARNHNVSFTAIEHPLFTPSGPLDSAARMSTRGGKQSFARRGERPDMTLLGACSRELR
ncbi:hypothetical protein FHU13_002940 [Methylobacterium sp. R2-1]|nr:hypothetical protein [Methylobacterium sp. R2-1]